MLDGIWTPVEKPSVKGYLHNIKASINPMVFDDLKERYSFRLSFLTFCPHFQLYSVLKCFFPERFAEGIKYESASRKMRIGVIFQGSLLAGGSFQQSISACKLLISNTNNREFIFTDESKNLLELEKHGIRAHLFKLSRLDRWIHKWRQKLKGSIIN